MVVAKSVDPMPAVRIVKSGFFTMNCAALQQLGLPDFIEFVMRSDSKVLVRRARVVDGNRFNGYKVSYVNDRKTGAVVTIPSGLRKAMPNKLNEGKYYAEPVSGGLLVEFE